MRTQLTGLGAGSWGSEVVFGLGSAYGDLWLRADNEPRFDNDLRRPSSNSRIRSAYTLPQLLVFGQGRMVVIAHTEFSFRISLAGTVSQTDSSAGGVGFSWIFPNRCELTKCFSQKHKKFNLQILSCTPIRRFRRKVYEDVRVIKPDSVRACIHALL